VTTKKKTSNTGQTTRSKSKAEPPPEAINPLDEPAPNKGGRPPFVVNYEQLRTLCGIRCPGRECAAVLGTRYETLDKRLREDYAAKLEVFDKDGNQIEMAEGFREFFRVHSINGKAALRRAIWESAIKDRNSAMLRYLGDRYLRIGEGGPPIPPGGESEIPPEEMREYTRESLNEELQRRGLPTHLLTDGR
jgi:hypothetical protein